MRPLRPHSLRVGVVTERTWIGEAKAAFDQSVTEATAAYDRARERPDEDVDEPDFRFWVSRAQAAAAIASAEQARIANLIAWKALQTQRQSGPDNGIDLLDLGGDEITQQIQEGLELG